MHVREDVVARSKISDIGRWYVTQFVHGAAASLAPGTRILDAGAGECAYRSFFAHCDYKAADLAVGEANWNYGNLDYVAPLDDLPIESASFDAVMCTEVLEHLEKPLESLGEMQRVLKPGGRLFLSAPMAHPEHQIPYDFFRYTSYGLRSLCERAGFVDVKVTPMGGLFARWAYELPFALWLLPRAGLRSGNPRLLGVLALPVKAAGFIVVRLLQALLLAIDPIDWRRDFPLGWAVEARKP